MNLRNRFSILIGVFFLNHAFGQETLVPDSVFALLKYGKVVIEDPDGTKRTFESNSESISAQAIRLRAGGSLHTTKGTRCDLVVSKNGTIRVQPETSVKLPASSDGGQKTPLPGSLHLLTGKLFLDIDAVGLKKANQQFRLKTPTALLAVKGTRFFATTGDEFDTVGVHEGTVMAYDPLSKASATVQRGNAVSTKDGAISRVRKLTPEELTEKEWYNQFALNYSDSEVDKRQFRFGYRVYDHPTNPSAKTAYHEFMEVSQEGSVLKVSLTPYSNPQLRFEAHANVKLSTPSLFPVGVYFSIRTRGIKTLGATGFLLKVDDQVMGFGHTSLEIAEAAEEWVPFYIPLELDPSTIGHVTPVSTMNGKGDYEPGQYTAEGEIAFGIYETTTKTEKAILEISPISIVTRPN